MSFESMRAAGATGEPIVDGPFATNPVFCAMLARLAGRPVRASALREGTAAGAALLGRMTGNGELPKIALELKRFEQLEAPGIEDYIADWRRLAGT